MILENLKNIETVYLQVIDNVSEVLFIISTDWQTVYFISPSYEKVWGKSCQSLLERPLTWIDALHPEDKAGVLDYIEEKSRATLSEITFPDYRIVKPDGSITWIQARCVPIYDEQGEVSRLAGIAVDITERKQMEAERENLIQSLHEALHEIKTLKGIIPICAYCKSIRNDAGAWDQIDKYIAKHSQAEFSHGICPDCMDKVRLEAGSQQ